MTYTINDDCSVINLNSDYLTATNQTVNLHWIKNCTGAASKISISVLASSIQLSPSDLEETTTFSDGVYYFKLEIVQEDGSMIEESLCRFVNCTSSCLMIPTYKETDLISVVKQLAFEALLASNNCTSCSCSDLCLLYNNTGLTDIDNDDCGCN